MPKLLLLGTNDPCWTVDSLRHYWDDLPAPKLVFQTPNGGHTLGQDASETLAAFFQMIADQDVLPNMECQVADRGRCLLTVKVNRPAKAIHLWTAVAATRDFRTAEWSDQPLAVQPGSRQASAEMEKPATGYRAFMAKWYLLHRPAMSTKSPRRSRCCRTTGSERVGTPAEERSDVPQPNSIQKIRSSCRMPDRCRKGGPDSTRSSSPLKAIRRAEGVFRWGEPDKIESRVVISETS